MNNRILIVLLLLGAVIMTLACISNTQEQPSDEEQLIVAVSILPQADFVEQIGGNKTKAVVMIPPGASPVTYEPTANQLMELSDAKIYVALGSGLPFEMVWLDKIRSVNKNMLVINTSQGVDIIPKDPHVWLSPRSVKIQVENIYQGLVQVDPGNKDLYFQNKEQFLEELTTLDMQINESLGGSSNRSFMVFHPSWKYFARDYNLTMIPVEIEGKEPGVGDMVNLIETASRNNITVIFVQPQFSTKSAQVIADEIGASVVPIDPLGKDYITNMQIVTDAFISTLL